MTIRSLRSMALLLSMLATLATLATVAGSAGATATDVPETALAGPRAEAMNRYLEALVPFGFNGTALVAQHGEVLLHQAYGVADPTTGRPNTTSTMFSTGSVTKQFTATAIMKLASQGRLSPEDPMSKYIDGVPEDKAGITLHHLLTHTAGLRGSYGPDEESITRDDMVRRIFDEPLHAPPGETFEYSNAGFTLLAVIIENITGRPYENYLRDTLYLPNGMKSTGLTSFDVDVLRVARSHNRDRDYRSPADRPENAWNLYGNGGQLSTTADMYRWIRALRAGDLVPPEYQQMMFTRYAAEGPEGHCHYGYGWSICDTRRGGDVVWHNGGSMGLWGCAVYQYINDDAVFIVYTNSTIDGRAPEDDICVNLSRILFGEPVDMPPDLSAAGDVDATPFAGTYDFGDGSTIVVNAVDGGVAAAPRGQEIMMAMFPSGMNDMLPGYNDMTRAMIDAIRAGDFERAGRDVEMEANSEQTGGEWLRGWWKSIDHVDAVEGFEIIGTRFQGAAQTFVRLNFPDGTKDFCFYWMMGRCIGLEPASAPLRTLSAVAPNRFTAFNMQGGVLAVFPGDGTMRVEAMGRTIVGKRRGREF